MSLAARLNYLAMDRSELQCSVKELVRKMAQPTECDWAALKRVASFLLTAPRIVAKYRWGPIAGEVVVFVDANWASCLRTRNSTLGGAVLVGGRYVKSWSKRCKS